MMSSAEVLRGTLSLYNWREDELNNRRLDAILAVSHHRIQRFEQGFLLRGLDIEVTLDGSRFYRCGRCPPVWRHAQPLFRTVCRYESVQPADAHCST
ncbi:protein ImpG/VasA [Klebsiella pneumoniae subsp. ozaenae]|uniref:Protein ImpG/VasA n=1 Tax=Klebsiella pneumoniae subsp. ozaenae TaxID=574 RepID=A0A378BEJ4_KLEPO|nr:protein ImpG/VasA [Klebsiella pneumoniae subsp. ozaenae]